MNNQTKKEKIIEKENGTEKVIDTAQLAVTPAEPDGRRPFHVTKEWKIATFQGISIGDPVTVGSTGDMTVEIEVGVDNVKVPEGSAGGTAKYAVYKGKKLNKDFFFDVKDVKAWLVDPPEEPAGKSKFKVSLTLTGRLK